MLSLLKIRSCTTREESSCSFKLSEVNQKRYYFFIQAGSQIHSYSKTRNNYLIRSQRKLLRRHWHNISRCLLCVSEQRSSPSRCVCMGRGVIVCYPRWFKRKESCSRGKSCRRSPCFKIRVVLTSSFFQCLYAFVKGLLGCSVCT